MFSRVFKSLTKQKSAFLFWSLVLWMGFGRAQAAVYYSSDAEAVVLKITAALEMDSSKLSLDLMKQEIADQLRYLGGSNSTSGYPRAPLEFSQRLTPFNVANGGQIEVLEVKKEGLSKERVRVLYTFTVDGFVPVGTKKLNVLLPIRELGTKSSCNDHGDFPMIYYFNPFLDSCPYKEGQDFELFKAEVIGQKLTGETQTVLPFGSFTKDKKQVRALLFFSPIGATLNENLDQDTGDSGGNAAKKIIESLAEKNYSVVKTAQKKNEWMYRVLRKSFADGKSLEVTVVYGNSTASFASQFNRQNSFYNYDVIGYSGHSGYGNNSFNNLLREQLQSKFTFPPYQFFFVDACSSIAYLARDLHQGKRANFHLLGHTLETSDISAFSNSYGLIRTLEEFLRTGVEPSIESVLDQIDRGSMSMIVEK